MWHTETVNLADGGFDVAWADWLAKSIQLNGPVDEPDRTYDPHPVNPLVTPDKIIKFRPFLWILENESPNDRHWHFYQE